MTRPRQHNVMTGGVPAAPGVTPTAAEPPVESACRPGHRGECRRFDCEHVVTLAQMAFELGVQASVVKHVALTEEGPEVFDEERAVFSASGAKTIREYFEGFEPVWTVQDAEGP